MRCRRPLITTIVAVCAAAVLAAGCGGAGSSPTISATSSTAASNIGKQFVAFAGCMRSHGVPGYPDPQTSASGNRVQVSISPGTADPNSPAFKSTDRACRRLAPDLGAAARGGADSAQQRAQDLQFSDCMRAHGVPSFPDADHDGAFTLPSTSDQQAPAFLRAMHTCQNVQPSSLSILTQPPGSS